MLPARLPLGTPRGAHLVCTPIGVYQRSERRPPTQHATSCRKSSNAASLCCPPRHSEATPSKAVCLHARTTSARSRLTPPKKTRHGTSTCATPSSDSGPMRHACRRRATQVHTSPRRTPSTIASTVDTAAYAARPAVCRPEHAPDGCVVAQCQPVVVPHKTLCSMGRHIVAEIGRKTLCSLYFPQADRLPEKRFRSVLVVTCWTVGGTTRPTSRAI